MVNARNAGTEVLIQAEVFGSDGEKVGSVSAVYPGYIVVEKGFFFPTDYYIPRSEVASNDGNRIYLAVSKNDALHRGWDKAPGDLETAGMSAPRGVALGVDRLVGTQVAATEGELRIPVVEEELVATVRPQQAGAVRIEKDIVSEERFLDVPVTEEHVRIERRVVDRPATAADAAVFEDTVIEVPLRSETVDVQKQARVIEEVVISKEAVQRTERVSGTVRKEEVHVDEDGVTDPTLLAESERGSAPLV